MTRVLITPSGDRVSAIRMFDIDGTEVTLDHDIPIPCKPKLPYDAMSIGDSFTVPRELRLTVSRQIATANKRQGGRRYIYRTYGNTVRVWRVA